MHGTLTRELGGVKLGTITVGSELNRLRRRQGISQFDLAVCMEWKGTNPIIQIEKDRRIPKTETIERWGECIGLNYLEIHYLNGLAGYVLPTRLPPRDVVVRTLEYVADMIKDVPFPAYVVDYQFRIWLTNPATTLFTLGDAAKLHAYMQRPLNVLDMIFDSSLGMRSTMENLPFVEQAQIFRFKASNAFRQHEAFFQAYPECMNYLSPEDYTNFVKHWQSIDMAAVANIKSMPLTQYYARMEWGDIQSVLPQGDMAFHLMVESILQLGDLFQIVTLLPVVSAKLPENKAQAEAIIRKVVPTDAQTLKLWELVDIERFY